MDVIDEMMREEDARFKRFLMSSGVSWETMKLPPNLSLPAHKCGLTLPHNEHKNYYETAEQWDIGLYDRGYPMEWISEEQRTKAIAENNVWVIQWYPETPIGFCRMAACDLDALLEAANAHDPRIR